MREIFLKRIKQGVYHNLLQGTGIELSDLGLRITNRLLYVPNQTQYFNFFTNYI